MRALVVTLVLTAACSGGMPTPNLNTGDAGADGPASDASTIDAAPGPAVAINNMCGAPISSYTFPVTQVGQTATAWFDIPGDDLLVQLDGSPAFAGFREGTGPRFLIVGAPPAPGTYATSIVVTRAGVEQTRIPITLVVVTPVGGLFVQTPSQQGGGGLVLTNRTTSTPIALRGLSIVSQSGGPARHAVDFSVCPRTLQPGDSCTMNVRVANLFQLGCHNETLTILSDSTPLEVLLEGGNVRGTARVHSLHGTVTSNPAGISCANQTNCTSSFTTDSVELTATPDPGFRFVGWDLGTGCGPSAICTIPVDALLPRAAQALFAAITTPTITITVESGSNGRVIFLQEGVPPLSCTGTCTFAAHDPTLPIRLLAAERSRFVGWTGSTCTGASEVCNLGVPTGDLTIGATFAPVAGEIATLTPVPHRHVFAMNAAAFLPGGDVVFAMDSHISRMTLADEVVWSIQRRADALVTDASGGIYYQQGTQLTKLTAAGTQVWSIVVDYPPGEGSCRSNGMAVLSNGNVAVATSHLLRVVSGATGSELWRVPLGGCISLATDQIGNVGVAVDDALSSSGAAVHRYNATGTRLVPDWVIPADTTNIELDSQNQLVVLSASTSVARLTRLNPVGQEMFVHTWAAGPSDNRARLTVLSNGDIVTADWSDTSERFFVRRFSTLGALLATEEISQLRTATSLMRRASGVTADDTGRLLMFGWEEFAGGWPPAPPYVKPVLGWARVMTMP